MKSITRILLILLMALTLISPVDAQRRRSRGGGCNCAMCQIIRAYGRQAWNAYGYNAPAVARQQAMARQQAQQRQKAQAPKSNCTPDQCGPKCQPKGRGSIPDDIRRMAGAQGTPMTAVDEMIELANVRSMTVLDPGCGSDARLLIAAVRAGAAKGIGFEIDAEAAEQAREAVRAANLDDSILIYTIDCREAYWGEPDIVLVYLFPELLGQLTEQFLRSGKVVSYAHQIPGMSNERFVLDGAEFFVVR